MSDCADSLRPLPKSLQQIADVIGRESTLILARQLPRVYSKKRSWGSAVLYVPKRACAEHRLVKILGQEKADLLVGAFHGENFILPPGLGKSNQFENVAILRMLAEGVPQTQVEFIFDRSDRHIRRLKAAARKSPSTGRAPREPRRKIKSEQAWPAKP